MKDKLTDWIGESVDRDSCPQCEKHSDCFACVEGYCTALRIPDGRVSKKKTEKGECPFYKTEQEARKSGIRGYRRLKENGRMDLIIQHADVLIHTGAMDDELREADHQAESLELFREENLSSQMEKAKAGEKTEQAEAASPEGA